MTPLGKVVAGLVVVVLDLRINGVDLVPDPIGWLLALAGFWPLARQHAGLAVAGVAAAAGIVTSLPQEFADPGTVSSTIELVVETIVLFGTCTALRALVPEPRVRRTANLIRWADVGLNALAAAVGLGLGEEPEITAGGAALVIVLVLVALGVFVWFLVLLWTLRRRPELRPGDLLPADTP